MDSRLNPASRASWKKVRSTWVGLASRVISAPGDRAKPSLTPWRMERRRSAPSRLGVPPPNRPWPVPGLGASFAKGQGRPKEPERKRPWRRGSRGGSRSRSRGTCRGRRARESTNPAKYHHQRKRFSQLFAKGRPTEQEPLLSRKPGFSRPGTINPPNRPGKNALKNTVSERSERIGVFPVLPARVSLCETRPSKPSNARLDSWSRTTHPASART